MATILNMEPSDKHRLMEGDSDEEGGIGGGKAWPFSSGVVSGSSVAAAHVSIRLGFIRKVLGILSVQLLFTAVITAAFVYTPGLKGLVQQWSWMVGLGFFLSLGLLFAMMVKRKDSPTNFVLLGLWTVVQAYTVGVLASFFDRDVVAQAALLTAAVVVGLALYSFQTRRDFSALGGGLFACLLILILGGVLQIFLMNETLDFVLAMAGALVFSLFIIYDLQNLMQRTDPEEYILATIDLYLDIINLFIHILRILQYLKGRD